MWKKIRRREKREEKISPFENRLGSKEKCNNSSSYKKKKKIVKKNRKEEKKRGRGIFFLRRRGIFFSHTFVLLGKKRIIKV